ncbi:MAG: hypothetical protein ACO23H_09885 [Alphaproteobacteria bacterium]
MAVQITGRQIANAAVDVNKLDLSSGTFDFQSAVLQVATPSADSHAATKGYVDALAQGLHWKDSVKVATTANITLSGTQTIDGIAVSADERVLVKDQTSGAENGIYVAASGAWSRAADMNASDEFSGAAIFVQQGTANADTGYVCTNDGAVTVGTTAITFTQFTGAGQLSGGDGIDITGSTISVNVDDSSIEISADALQVKDGGITNDHLAGSIANGKLANSTISGVALGGTLGALSASASGAITMTSYDGSAAVANVAVNVDGASIEISSNALQIKDGGVSNAKLENSTISGVALGSNLNSLSAGNGITMTSYNGSAAVSDLTINLDGATLSLSASGIKVADAGIDTAQLADSAVTAVKLAGSIPADKLNLGNGVLESAGNLQIDLDGSTLALGVNGIKVADAGVDTAQLADGAVETNKIADAQITTQKLKFGAFFAAYDADGSTDTFALSAALDLDFVEMFVVTVNGLVMEYKATPDAQDNYKIDNGGAGGVGQIVFGSNLANGDRVTVRGFIND